MAGGASTQSSVTAEPSLNSDVPILHDFQPVSVEEVVKIVNESPTKSCSADPIPTWLLKKHMDVVGSVITRIVNLSLESGIFPSSMKMAQVVPLLKKPSLDSEQLKNYRPVSNLTFLSKVIERVVAVRLDKHMASHKLYEPLQSAYREYHGTETALLKVHNDILRALDNRRGVYLVLLDLSAAFDTIDHTILLDRLRVNVGVHGNALQWLKSYLTERYQSVVIKGQSSKTVKLSFGVPQGSVLGPKLFTVYSAPIANICRKHNVDHHMYADDTQLYLSFNLNIPGDQIEILHRIETCIVEIRDWMTLNKLKLNEDKTEFLVIASPHHRPKVSVQRIQVCESQVECVGSAKNLGSLFDHALNMGKHVTTLCQAAYFRLKGINSIRKSLTKDATEILIHAFVTSRLDNANALLMSLPTSSLMKLQRIQHAAARTILGMRKRDHITPALIELHWLPIKQRILYKILFLTWKALNNQAPGYVCHMLVPLVHKRCLRSNDQRLLVVPISEVIRGSSL